MIIRTIFLLIIPSFTVNSYNIDVLQPILINNPDASREKSSSNFGFSVSLIEHSLGNWVVIGAPTSNNSYWSYSPQDIEEPGLLYRCKITKSSTSCEALTVDQTGNIFSPDTKWKEYKNHEWLGVSIDVSVGFDPTIMTCGHRWCNDIYMSGGRRFMNGICYWANFTRLVQSGFDSSVWNKGIPLVDINKQSVTNPSTNFAEYMYELGQAGIATHFKQDGRVLVGAPGVHMWRGTVIEIDIDPSVVPNYRKKRSIISHFDVPLPAEVSSPYNYAGYSISSGIFKNNEELMVVGAPRAGIGGMVYIMKSEALEDTSNLVDETQLVGQWWERGPQDWSYFGASVTAIDLDNDGIDEVVVGAPLYVTDPVFPSEDGTVYIFSLLKDGTFNFEQTHQLIGDAKMARFGSSLSSVGDLDLDGYNDLVIGAPFENAERGSVYIYRGGKFGLQSRYSQKIQAGELYSPLRHFGLSISRGADISDDEYKDFAVGAPGSGHVVILKGRPIARVSATLVADVTALTEPDSCFILDLCVTYTGKSVISYMDMEGSVDLDSERGSSPARAYLRPGSSSTFNLALAVDSTPKCLSLNGCLNNTQEILDPLHVVVQLSSSQLINDTRNCLSCDMIHPESDMIVKTSLILAPGCGSDTTCQPEIQILNDYKSDQYPFIIGSNDLIKISTTIKILEEWAYSPSIMINLPPNVFLSSLSLFCTDEEMSSGSTEIKCKLPNQMKDGEEISVHYSIQVSGYSGMWKDLKIDVTAGAHGTQDVTSSLLIPVKDKFDLQIHGDFIPEVITYYVENNNLLNKTVKTKFTSKIENLGITPVKDILVMMKFPYSILTESGVRVTIFSDPLLGIGEHGVCSLVDIEDIACSEPPEYFGSGFEMSCGNPNFEYKILQCSMIADKQITSSHLLTVNISSILGTTNLDKSFALEIQTELIGDGYTDLSQQSPNIGPDSESIWLVLVPQGWKPPTKTQEVAWWVYVISIIGGSLVLVVLVIVLKKCGFFNRNRISQANTDDVHQSEEELLDSEDKNNIDENSD